MKLKRRKYFRMATMDDLDFLNNLFRKQHKKWFPFLRIEQIEERINENCVFISKENNYVEMIRIYKKKSKLANGHNKKIYAKQGDVNLLFTASVNPGQGTGSKYRPKLIKELQAPGRTFFSITRSTNKGSQGRQERCGFHLFDKYTKGNHTYFVYVNICKNKKRCFLK